MKKLWILLTGLALVAAGCGQRDTGGTGSSTGTSGGYNASSNMEKMNTNAAGGPGTSSSTSSGGGSYKSTGTNTSSGSSSENPK
ncbi:hypothetical protein [Pedosphaera parvula]|uniref:Putative topoisomerase n=1 Tax=Pedosphaera parvula (strain Ellin514) TaxID=320771 RepID=B9XB84_PEDPL|nr:hypothetical protein [Pedosphaera parvula]EEF62769.1 putative topoisomerase [Pedosphaera parvula Ellin514]